MLSLFRRSTAAQPQEQVDLPKLADLLRDLDSKEFDSRSHGRIKADPDGALRVEGVPYLHTRSKLEALDERTVRVTTEVRHPKPDIVKASVVRDLSFDEAFERAKTSADPAGSITADILRAATYEVLRVSVMASATEQFAKNLSKFNPDAGRHAASNDSWGFDPNVRWSMVRGEVDGETGLPVIAIAPKLTVVSPQGERTDVTLPLRLYPDPASFADCAMHYCKSASDGYTLTGPDGFRQHFVFGQDLLNHAWGSAFADSGATLASLLRRSELLKALSSQLDNVRLDALQAEMQRSDERTFWSEAGADLRLKMMLLARGAGEPGEE